MKKSHLTLIVIAILIAIAIFTNPNLAAHKEAVKNKVNTYMQNTIKENSKDDESGETGQAIGMLVGGALIDKMVDNIVSTDNYIVFSTTKVTWEGKSRIIGIGIFGNVYISKEISDKMAKATTTEQ